MVAVARGPRNLLAKRRLVPRVRLVLHPVRKDGHQPQRCMCCGCIPEARVPRCDAHRWTEASVRAEARVVELLEPPVRRPVVPPVGGALDVRVTPQVVEGVLQVHDVDVRHQHRRAHREEGAHKLELLGRDLVRAERLVGPGPAGHLLRLEPLRQPLVNRDDEHVGDAGAPVRLDPLGELTLHVGVCDADHHLAPHRCGLDRGAELRSAVKAGAVDRPLGAVRGDGQVERSRRKRLLAPRHAAPVLLAVGHVRRHALGAKRAVSSEPGRAGAGGADGGRGGTRIRSGRRASGARRGR
mmetsp:Transcript_8358/g.24239  ORF Transcript_8358/g.24239 Transcript_8358/m.24239 type:complete len:297 (+) Transcript_8358:1242-2132(+)